MSWQDNETKDVKDEMYGFCGRCEKKDAAHKMTQMYIVYKKAHFTLILLEFHVILYFFSPQPQALCLTLVSINMLAAGDIIQGNKRSVDPIMSSKHYDHV